jgi:hypothetical protein
MSNLGIRLTGRCSVSSARVDGDVDGLLREASGGREQESFRRSFCGPNGTTSSTRAAWQLGSLLQRLDRRTCRRHGGQSCGRSSNGP